LKNSSIAQERASGESNLISALLYYLYQLDTKTNASDKVISEIAEVADENIKLALRLLIKNGLIK
jgi:hypothetical protein